MKNSIRHVTFILALLAAIVTAPLKTVLAAPALAPANQASTPDDVPDVLSPIWGPSIQRWSSYIAVLSDFYGLDPDFIAAVIDEESNGDPLAVSRVGAVGLMGIMPAGPGLEWRPPADELENPSTNLRWGVAILAEIVRQSGGDLYAALAAYSGGWSQVERSVPREYAARVLNSYGRAVAKRSGISPDIASQWTLAVEIRQGDVPNDSLLVLGNQPISGLLTYGEHIVYNYIDQSGRAYFVKAYAVPVALVMPVGDDRTAVTTANDLEMELQARLNQTAVKISESNPGIIEACLPSLSRLRGRASTRWFAPSYCPSWHR
ncbi:MAG: transglycosylase SLT domain-containing protein [Ardenticatenaceae bacterium]|nr:transglycosylase SLT domain-containing protein [Ardenticatenaceae bacterium]MCB9443177.1 transglycosylase SLT domain-containing protein [Ardenticatenaceae bacterium]